MSQDGLLNLTDFLISSTARASTSQGHLALGSSSAISSSTGLLSTPSAASYLNHLTSLSLPSLLSEPEALQTHAHHLTSSLTSLTHSAYPSFLALHETTESLTSALASLSQSASTLLSSSLPSLEDAALRFRERSEPIVRERRKVRGVIEQGDKLQDLLDVPRLMDTCVRNGYFSEALALAAHICPPHATGASKENGVAEDNEILRSIRAEVDVSLRGMLAQLLNTLREPGRKLPALWKAVNVLRRLEVLGEEELALTFLCDRAECLQSALQALERESGVSRDWTEENTITNHSSGEDEARFLRKYIDMWREGVYDIVMQYNTIFLEEHSAPASLPSFAFSLKDTLSQNFSRKPPSKAALHDQLRSLLATYASQALNSYLLPVLRVFLPRITPTTYSAFLTQLTYCGAAFARVGLDFRALLAPLFSDAIRVSISREMRALSQAWTDKLKKQRRPLSTWLVVPMRATANNADVPLPPQVTDDIKVRVRSGPAHEPPHVLASYPPLADLTNALLSILNGLRLLAPVAIAQSLLQTLDEVLTQCAQALKDVADRTKVDQLERSVGGSAGRVFVDILVPFLRRALVEGVYGGEIGHEPRKVVNGDALNGKAKVNGRDHEEDEDEDEENSGKESESSDLDDNDDDDDDGGEEEEEGEIKEEKTIDVASIDPESSLGVALRQWESWLTLYYNQ